MKNRTSSPQARRRLGRAFLSLAMLGGIAVYPGWERVARADERLEAARPWEVFPTSAKDYVRCEKPSVGARVYIDRDETHVQDVGGFQGNRPSVFVETWLPQPNDRKRTDPDCEKLPDDYDKQWPVIFHPTVYANGGAFPDGRADDLANTAVQRGFAFSMIHLPGSGNSPGCISRHDQAEALATSAAVEYFAGSRPDSKGELVEWSNHSIGGAGISYSGGALVNVAARGTDEARNAIRAIVAAAPHISDYETQWIFDGVRSTLIQPIHSVGYFVLKNGGAPGGRTVWENSIDSKKPEDTNRDPLTRVKLGGLHPESAWRRFECHSVSLADNATNPQGDVSEYFAERDLRRLAKEIRTPIFTMHGHSDVVPINGVPPMVQAGFFDQLPESTPKVGLFGVWGHELPSSHSGSGIATIWNRADIGWMISLWFDHWVKGLADTGVESWPVAQVQGTDGQWRVEPEWPTTGGPAGQLALGPSSGSDPSAGSLGATDPTGQSSYTEGLANEVDQISAATTTGKQLVFETEKLTARLQITGQPVADLWIRLDRPDAHIAATLEILDENDNVMGEIGKDGQPSHWTYGLRSVRHLVSDGEMQAGMKDNFFVQGEAQQLTEVSLAPDAIRVPVRFQPTDLVVPAGGRLRLTIAGSIMVNTGLDQRREFAGNDPILGFSEPSGMATNVTVLHDCSEVAPAGSDFVGTPMVSTLRFLMPREDPDFINVREKSEYDDAGGDVQVPLPVNEVTGFASDGGLATAPVCGQQSTRIEDVISSLGPEIPYEAPNWRPDASLDVSPTAISGNGPIDITAAVIDYDGASDIVQADLTIVDANERLVAAWDLDDFAPLGDWQRVMSVSDLKLSGPSPWTVTLVTTDGTGDSDIATIEIVRIDDEGDSG